MTHILSFSLKSVFLLLNFCYWNLLKKARNLLLLPVSTRQIGISRPGICHHPSLLCECPHNGRDQNQKRRPVVTSEAFWCVLVVRIRKWTTGESMRIIHLCIKWNFLSEKRTQHFWNVFQYVPVYVPLEKMSTSWSIGRPVSLDPNRWSISAPAWEVFFSKLRNSTTFHPKKRAQQPDEAGIVPNVVSFCYCFLVEIRWNLVEIP